MAIEETKVLLQHCLSVNPIFVVICGPKQQLQNYLSKASFMLFVFFKSTKWKHAYLLLPLKPERFSRMLSQFFHMLSSSIIAGVWALWFMGGPPTDLKNMAVWQENDTQDFHFQKHTFRARTVLLEKGVTANNTSRNEIRSAFA